VPIVKKIVLSSVFISFLSAQYFYTNGKKIYLKPAQSSQSRYLSSGKHMFTIQGTKEKIGIYNEVIFKLIKQKDLEDIRQKYNLKNIKKISKRVYRAKVLINSVFDISNQLYEDSRVEFAHPDLDIKIKTRSVLDNPLALYAGFLRSLEIEELWKIAPKKGENTIVAVLDTRVDVNHPDLRDNALDQHNPSVDTISNPSHGTNCIGIISASDNSIGSVGISPRSKFYSVTISPRLSETIMGVDWLVDKNVGVLSNSWGTVMYDGLNDALKNLSINGRNKKGTIIVFASGNSNINYDDNPEIEDQSELEFVIGVGATNTFGEKTNYSNYGENIDIYAFGGDFISGLITATLEDKYTGRFGGTSASAPLLTGVISLMLSINPELEFKQVKKILEDTADITPLGYKRLNAKQALLRVRDGIYSNGGKEVQNTIDEIVDVNNTKILEVKQEISKIAQAILSIGNINIGRGWNILGTSFNIDTIELHKKYKNINIYTQDRNNLETIEYINEPLQIKAGEGFWIYKQ